MVFTKKATVAIIGLALLPLVAVEAVFINSNFVFAKPTKATQSPMVLDSSNAPTISGGSAVVTDIKNVTWEYSGAANKANYHVSLDHQGYFGIKSTTAWGYTKIEGITVTFTGTSTSELWLLTSVDGLEWHEHETLTSGTETTSANDWRFIRFYHYDDCGEGNTPGCVDIQSVSISYGCTGGVSATEDVDLAKVGNVRESSILQAETTNTISPRSDGGQALRLYNGQSGDSSYIVVSFPQVSSWHDIFNDKIEFDFCHTNNQYKPSIQLMKDTKGVGGTQKWDSNRTSYRVTDINSDWWHIELSINAMVALYVDHGDTPTGNSAVNGIKIVSRGNCIIDNLRIGSSETPLGNYNKPSSEWMPSVGGYLWVKTCWVGKLHSVNIPNTALTTYEPTDKSPFYVYCKASRTVDVVVEIVCGYDHRTERITKSITIKS